VAKTRLPHRPHQVSPNRHRRHLDLRGGRPGTGARRRPPAGNLALYPP